MSGIRHVGSKGVWCRREGYPRADSASRAVSGAWAWFGAGPWKRKRPGRRLTGARGELEEPISRFDDSSRIGVVSRAGVLVLKRARQASTGAGGVVCRHNARLGFGGVGGWVVVWGLRGGSGGAMNESRPLPPPPRGCVRHPQTVFSLWADCFGGGGKNFWLPSWSPGGGVAG